MCFFSLSKKNFEKIASVIISPFVILLGVITLNPTAEAQVLSLSSQSVISDTLLSKKNAHRNFGKRKTLRMKQSERLMIRVRQDRLMAMVGERSVERAILRLPYKRKRLKSSPGAALTLFRLNRYWNEDSATWNCPGQSGEFRSQRNCGSQAWTGGISEAPLQPTLTSQVSLAGLNQGFVDIDVTGDVQAYLKGEAFNFGWMIAPIFSSKNEYIRFTASEGERLSFGRKGPSLELDLGPEVIPDMIQVASDRWNFVKSQSGQVFVPMGADCCNPATAKTESEFLALVGDLNEQVAMGFNVTRILLQFPDFVLSPTVANEDNLIRLDRLVRAAKTAGITLNLTGLGHFRKEALQPWYLRLSDDEMMEADAFFWKSIASRYRSQPSVFCFDIENEPMINGNDYPEIIGPGDFAGTGNYFITRHFREIRSRFTDWVKNKYSDESNLRLAWPDYPRPGESWNSVLVPPTGSHLARLSDHYDFLTGLSDLWMKRMHRAIRDEAQNTSTLITVGLTDWSLPFQDLYSWVSPLQTLPYVDFVSLHFYPDYSQDPLARIIANEVLYMNMRAGSLGKPMVIEETWAFGGEVTEMFLERAIKSSSGVITHYFGKTPDEERATGTLGGAIRAAWFDRFSQFIKNETPQSGMVRTPGTRVIQVSQKELRLDRQARINLFLEFRSNLAAGIETDIELHP